ncbi:MAG: hypothetical protein WCF78_02540 [archaeon]
MAKSKNAMEKVGAWSFIIGVILAIIAGIFFGASAVVTSILIILGIIVGFLNITDRETSAYLLASVSLVIVTSLGGAVLGNVAVVGMYLESILGAILTFVIPAVIIVALKAIYSIANN